MAGPTDWRLSLVIPAFNEAVGIEQAIVEADAALATHAADYEILVVDDGSRDETFDAATSAAGGRPHVRVLRHSENRGYGAALRTGFEAAKFDRVAFTDADCQFDLNDLAKLAPLSAAHPVVVGYRVDRQDPWRRKFLSRGYNLIVRTLLGTRVRDCDCALKVFRKSELHHLLPESRNFFVNTEMLTRARQHGYSIAEVGVTHRPRAAGRSKVSMGDVPKTLATLIPFWWSTVMFPGRPDAARSRGGLLAFMLVILLAGLMFFNRISLPLLEPEEVRYAEIPRQMLGEGSWLVPTLNGQPYLDKPPLMYWLVMGSYSIFGVHDWAARLVVGFLGVGIVAATFGWAYRSVSARAAVLASVALLFSVGFVYYGRMVTMNAPLALCTTAALAAAHIAMLPDAKSRSGWWILAGAALGLGLLAKGPVAAVLVIPPILLLGRLDPRLNRPGWSMWGLMALAAVLVAVPWFVLVSIREPQFAYYFFWFHHVVRFVEPFDHQRPFWDYLPTLLLGLTPWTLLAIPAFRFITGRSQRTALRRPAALGAFLLIGVWMFLFFSASGAKRPVYLVPVFPPFALTVGCCLNAALPRERINRFWNGLLSYRHSVAYWSVVGVLSTTAVACAASAAVGLRKPERVLLLGGAAVLTLAFLFTANRRRRLSWAMGVFVGSIAVFFCINTLLPEYMRRFSLRHPVQMAATTDDRPVVCYPRRWESVSYYGKAETILAFPRDRREEMIHFLNDEPGATLVIQSKYLNELLAEFPTHWRFVTQSTEAGVTIGTLRRDKSADAPVVARND